MTLPDFIRRILCLLMIAACFVVALLCAGCQSPKVRTTTTRMGLTGAQETTMTEVPWESSFDRAFGEAVGQVMASDFHP